jgi:hypothetical protein
LSRNFDARSAASEAQHQGRRPAAEYGHTGGMTWSRRFDAPIPLHSGDVIRTLKEAGEYIVGLSKAEQNKQHWQLAAQELMAAAERGGIVRLPESSTGAAQEARRELQNYSIARLTMIARRQPDAERPRAGRAPGAGKNPLTSRAGTAAHRLA